MRRFIFEAGIFLCLMFCALSARAVDDKGLANSISIPATTVSTGVAGQLAVELTNVTAFTAFQFDVVLPEGITVAQDAFGYLVALSDRGTSQHSIDGSVLSTGEFRVTCFSSKNINFTGNSGALCYIALQADGAMPSGDYPVEIKNVKFSEYVNDAVEGHLLENVNGIITVETALEIDDNQLYAKDIAINAGEDAVMNVYYNSVSDVYEYKTVVALPAGVTVEGVEFLPVVADVSNFTNNWSVDGNALTLTGVYGGGRRDVPAEGGNKMFATVQLNTSSLSAGVYDITFGEQIISNDDDDYNPESYVARLIVKGNADEASATMAIGTAKWGTFIAPFDVAVPSGVTASTVTGVDGNTLVLAGVGNNTIPANTPVVLYSDTPVSQAFTGTSTATADEYTVGLLTGVYKDYVTVGGEYVLQNNGGKVGFYHVDDVKPTVTAGHAYLTLHTLANPVNSLILSGNDETAVNTVKEATESADIYDLAGRRVASAAKGVYIINGKKSVKK